MIKKDTKQVVGIKIPKKEYKVKDLVFGLHVFSGDNLPIANSDALRVIQNEADLDSYKNTVDVNLTIVIDRTKHWFSVFTIPEFTKGIEAYKQRKHNQLQNWK